jgi:integrase
MSSRPVCFLSVCEPYNWSLSKLYCISLAIRDMDKLMKSAHLKSVIRGEKRPVASQGRKPNEVYRVREHLTEDEVAKLLVALKGNRHGHRDWLIGLLIYRHGLRVSETCDLRWDDISLAKRTITVRRLKGSDDSTHYLERDELAGLKLYSAATCSTASNRRTSS